MSSSEEVGAVVSYPALDELLEKLGSLEQALKQQHPAMESLLKTIHKNLSADPELVHLLKPEQRAVIFAGLQQKTKTYIVDETVKSSMSGKSKSLKNVSLDDL